MALDLFKRVETRKGLFAVEKITLIYNLLTSILILFLFQRMDHRPIQQHVPWMIHPLKQEQNQYGSQQIINQCNLFHSKQPFPGFYALK